MLSQGVTVGWNLRTPWALRKITLKRLVKFINALMMSTWIPALCPPKVREQGQEHSGVFSLILIVIALSAGSCQRSNPVANSPAPRADDSQAGPRGPAGFPPAVMNKSYPGTGVVVQINREEGWIEINHDEIKELMPAMQMEFWVKDKSLLDQANAGDRVGFTILETTSGEYLTELKRIAPVQSR